ncbi:MAG: serine hydrolase domain-containing protein [Acidimicrobiales bacterium]|jgi:CubicO group peptidase (beta-lactamase class C family)
MSEETIPVPLETELDAFFGQYTAAERSRGLVYGLTTPEGGLSHCAGFGVVNDDGLVPDADTVFPIASMSKSFVACAALVARDQGFLSLSDPITAYLPEFVVSGDVNGAEGPPTVGMLFSMCGGLTEDNSWVDPFIDLPTETLLAQIRKGVHLSRYPGAEFEYSNLGFALAGLAVSRSVGRPLEDFVRDTLFVPLGLTSTYFDSAVPSDVPRAVGYSLDSSGAWVPFPPKASDAFAAAGGIMSNVRDLATWISWLGSAFRPPRGDGTEILSRASRRELQRIHIEAPPALAVGPSGAIQVTMSGYALGLRVTTDLHRGTFISHAGGLPGFKLFMTWHPASGYGAIVLTNSHRGDPIALCSEALGRVLSRYQVPASTVTLWPETVALQAQVEGLIRHWDDDLASRTLAENVDFDHPLEERRAEIDRLVAEVGPLLETPPRPEVVSAVTPADVTWSIPGRNGELLCMIHLTPVEPAQVQELVVKAYPASCPRAAIPVDISPRRAQLGEAFITPTTNVGVHVPSPEPSAGGAATDAGGG